MEPSGWSRRCTPSIAASLSTHSISSTWLFGEGLPARLYDRVEIVSSRAVWVMKEDRAARNGRVR